MLYWHCCSLVVLIGAGFRVFFPLLFFLKERLWLRRVLLGHVDTGGAAGAASLTSECKCGNRSTTTSAWVTRTLRECGVISFNTPLFYIFPNGTHTDLYTHSLVQTTQSCIILIIMLLQTAISKQSSSLNHIDKKRICTINTATAKKINHEVDSKIHI